MMSAETSPTKRILERVTLDSRVKVSCDMAMMGVLTDVGLREDKSWGDDEKELLGKLMESANKLAGFIMEDVNAASAKDAELIQRLVDAGNTMKQWLGLTLQMDGESCPDCRYDWGKGHNAGCYQLRHLEAIEAWDAAARGFKPSDK